MYHILLCALLALEPSSTQIYDNPLAYVRSPQAGLSIQSTKYKGSNIQYLEGIIGRSVPVVMFEPGTVQLQLGLEAAAWLALGYDQGAFPLITQDFYFSFPLYFRHDLVSGALKFNHISSHKGDGMDVLVEDSISDEERAQIEQIEDQKDVDISLIQPVSYSRDYLSLEVAYEHTIHPIDVKSYVHIIYVHKMIPNRLKRWAVGNGTELKYETRWVDPYYAQDIRYNEDTDSIDYSGQLGIITSEEGLFKSRVALTGYLGSDRRGQFVGRKLKQVGIGFFIQ